MSITKVINRGTASAGALFLSLGIAAFSAAPVYALSIYDGDVLNDGAIGYWKMDRGVDDSIDLANTSGSTLNQGGHINMLESNRQLVAGDYTSNAFTGFAGYSNPDSWMAASTVGGTLYSPVNDFSVEAWIRPAFTPSEFNAAGIVNKSGSYGLFFDGPDLAFYTKVSGSYRICDDTATVDTNTVYHLVGTYDGSNMRLYVNGSLACTLSASGDIDTNSSAIVMGSWDTSDLFFGGDMSNVAIYGSALSSTQVASHFSDGSL